MTVPRWFFALSLGLTLLIYGIMVFWGSPILIREAGGLLPFDLRPFGYGAEEARAYLSALSDEGRVFYRDVIGRLDGVFPPLLALSLILCFLRLSSRRPAALLSAVAIAAAVLDLLENAGIARMLETDVASVTDAMVAHISRLTQLKWAADGVTLAALAALLARAVARRLQNRLQ
ncbi:hypothetical protein ACSBLW_08630 [Thioclava sp. FR2]|uniref:hypothetical protein n=1 Tax=Thioclava sp. FR2 TaxID=3445780 RepID=UPI003EBFAEAC